MFSTPSSVRLPVIASKSLFGPPKVLGSFRFQSNCESAFSATEPEWNVPGACNGYGELANVGVAPDLPGARCPLSATVTPPVIEPSPPRPAPDWTFTDVAFSELLIVSGPLSTCTAPDQVLFVFSIVTNPAPRLVSVPPP